MIQLTLRRGCTFRDVDLPIIKTPGMSPCFSYHSPLRTTFRLLSEDWLNQDLDTKKMALFNASFP